MTKPIFNTNLTAEQLAAITETHDGQKIIGRCQKGSVEMIKLANGDEVIRDLVTGQFLASWEE